MRTINFLGVLALLVLDGCLAYHDMGASFRVNTLALSETDGSPIENATVSVYEVPCGSKKHETANEASQHTGIYSGSTNHDGSLSAVFKYKWMRRKLYDDGRSGLCLLVVILIDGQVRDTKYFDVDKLKDIGSDFYIIDLGEVKLKPR